MIFRCRARLFAPLFLALAIFFGSSPAPRAAETVSVSAAMSNGSGTMVLDWPAPVFFSASIDGGNLVLKFSRPFDAVFAPAVSALGDFLLAGGLYPDRRTAVFALKRRDVVLRSYHEGPRVVVELFPVAPEKIPPAQKPQTAARPKPDPEPAAGPVRQPVREPVSEPVSKPVSKPLPEPVREPVRVLSPVERGRALLAENHPERALAAIAGESGRDAERLRLDAEWRRGDWRAASASAQKLSDGFGSTLADSDRRLVLDAAIAAVLARDEPALKNLHARFSAAMDESGYRHPFRLLAEPNDAGDPRERIARLTETAEGVRRFLLEAKASTARVP